MIYQIFGQITPPYKGSYAGTNVVIGIIPFIKNILRLFFLVGGLWFFFNLIIAGFQFLNAGGDAKNIENAWNKIWQSLVGLLIMVSSFIIASIANYILFGDSHFIFMPRIFGPN